MANKNQKNKSETYFKKDASSFRSLEQYADANCVCSKETADNIVSRLTGRQAGLDTNPEEDIYNVYVGVNVWCYIFHDVVGDSPNILLNRIRLCGLQAAIREANEHRLWIISEGKRGTASSFWLNYFSEAVYKNKLSAEKFAKKFRGCLSVLGCLRRIRLTCLDYSFMEQEFLASNQRCRFNYVIGSSMPQYSYIDYGFKSEDEVSTARAAGTKIPLEWNQTRQEWDYLHPGVSTRIIEDLAEIIAIIFSDYERDDSLFTLPQGVSYEGAHSYLEKFKYVEQEQEWLRVHGVNIPRTGADASIIHEPANCSRYIAVPKDYKTGRGVAPEPVSRQVLGYQISSGMRRCLRSFGIDLNDQSTNQYLASVAYDLGLSTVDKSSASDLISLVSVQELFKYVPELLSDLMAVRSPYVKVGNRKYLSYRAFTMGNAVTFDVETAIFLAVAIYSVWWSCPDRIEKFKKGVNLPKLGITVYGDDVELPNAAYVTYCEICSKLGFVINMDKSYTGADRYRESCGVEYWYRTKRQTANVGGIYYPRGISRKALPELLGLQHKYVEYPSVNYFLTSCVLDVFPDMTTSEVPLDPEQGSFDLWTTVPFIREVEYNSPHCSRLRPITIGFKASTQNPNEQGLKIKGCNASVRTYSIVLFENPWEEITPSAVQMAVEKEIPDGWYYVPKTLRIERGRMRTITKKGIDISYQIASYPMEQHYILSSKSTGVIPVNEADRVERLMYLLTIGNGIEHINSSDYTEEEHMIRDRRDLVRDRKVLITLKNRF